MTESISINKKSLSIWSAMYCWKKIGLCFVDIYEIFLCSSSFYITENSPFFDFIKKEKYKKAIDHALTNKNDLLVMDAKILYFERNKTKDYFDINKNLKSVLATLKLHFENLKMNREKKKINQEMLFDKTENIIDEVYLKVRNIANAKNAGVIAN